MADNIRTQRQVFEKRFKTLTVTIDVSKVTFTENGVKKLLAGMPLGQDSVGDLSGTKIDLLLNRGVKVQPANGNDAFGILTHDVVFTNGVDQQATICFAGTAYIDEVEDALTEMAGGATSLDALAITAMPEISLKKKS